MRAALLRVASAALLILVAGCADPPRLRQNLFVVLPDDDGKVGAITVDQGRGPTRLDTAFAAAQVGRTGQVERVEVSEAEAKTIFAAALAAQPALPSRFRLYFQQASETLTPESAADFEKVFADVSARAHFEMEVIGHTDTRGPGPVNQQLSERRAIAVARLVAARGLPTDRILTTGRGEADLLVPTPDETDEPRNRRVEIIVR